MHHHVCPVLPNGEFFRCHNYDDCPIHCPRRHKEELELVKKSLKSAVPLTNSKCACSESTRANNLQELRKQAQLNKDKHLQANETLFKFLSADVNLLSSPVISSTPVVEIRESPSPTNARVPLNKIIITTTTVCSRHLELIILK